MTHLTVRFRKCAPFSFWVHVVLTYLEKTYSKSSDSMFSVSSGIYISLRWGCLLVNEKLKKTNLPQAPRNTHAGRFRVWQLAIFSLPLEHFIPLRIFLIYSHNTTCALSTVPYQPVHYSLHHAQIECDFWLREWFYSLKLCRFFFSGGYYICFAWPTASSVLTSRSPSLPHRLQTSAAFIDSGVCCFCLLW